MVNWAFNYYQLNLIEAFSLNKFIFLPFLLFQYFFSFETVLGMLNEIIIMIYIVIFL